jgi:predicted phosphodiesterase
MSDFRLLHVSDFHFSIWPSQRHWYEIFSQTPWASISQYEQGKLRNFPTGYSPQIASIAAKVIFEMRSQFDLLAITGDVATTEGCLASAREFTHSMAQFKWLNSEYAPTLQAANKAMILLPGNHDRYKDNSGAPGGTHFNVVYQDEWRKPHRYVNHRVIEKDGEALACLAVDFCLRKEQDAGKPYRVNRWGRGKAYDDAIKNLETRTKAIRRRIKNVTVIWLAHFPAMSSTPSKYRLNDARAFIAAADRQQIPLILSGHLHKNRIAEVSANILSKRIPILCAGSMTAVADKSWMHFVDISVTKGKIDSCSKVDFKWSDKRKNFGREKTHQIV